MIKKYLAGVLLLLSLVPLACQGTSTGEDQGQLPAKEEAYERMVSLCGAISELLFAMSKGDQVLGIDVTSTFPSEPLERLPLLGHVQNLNIEAALGLHLDLIIEAKSVEYANPLAKLAESGIKIPFLEQEYKLDNPGVRAQEIAEVLGPSDYAESFQTRIPPDLETLKKQISQFGTLLSELFIYARGTGSMIVAENETPAAAMIEWTVGKSTVDEFDGFMALASESIGGWAGLQETPGMKEVTAGQREQFIAMDGLYLLDFTPRASRAAIGLSQRLLTFQQRNSSLKRSISNVFV